MPDVSDDDDDDNNVPPEPKHSKADYDRHKDDLQHLKANELIENAIEFFGEPLPK